MLLCHPSQTKAEHAVQLKPGKLKMDPIFSAVSSNVHQLYTLLQCIGFSPRATVQITPDGIRVSVEEGRVVQALAFLDKALFTSYTFRAPHGTIADNTGHSSEGNDNDGDAYPHFVISLSALLETLKIFGINDPSSTAQSRSTTSSMQQPTSSASNAFTAPSLLLDRSCTLQYLQPGSPLSITLSETGVKTTCELTTYEPEEDEADIPLQRDAIVMKIIMRSAWLHNAISELASTNPTILKISASAKREPFFALSGSGGPFSESTVEFSIDEQQQPQNGHVPPTTQTGHSRSKRTKMAPTVTETFLVNPPSSVGNRIKQDYRFALIRKAARAMAVANKVSIRGDRQGVLSLQFMIEFGDDASSGMSAGARAPGAALGSTVSFVDFRFVPLLDDDEVENDQADEEEED